MSVVAADRSAPPAFAAALELAALGTALTLTVAWLARLPSWYRELGTFQALFAIAFVFYAVTVARLRRYAELPRAGLAVFAVAFACRALLVPLEPSLSGDLYRFVWEGRVWLAGGNPYTQAPLDPALVVLRDTRIFPFVNHPELATLYPPLAEAGFALVAAIAPTVVAFKSWIALHDLALVAVLVAWSRRERGSGVWALIYAWNPLTLVEYAGSGHNDPTALLGLALALMLAERRPMVSAVALAWGALTKLVPLLALPYLMRRWPWRARLLAVALLLPGLAWFAWETQHPQSGLRHYWSTWRNNAPLFALAERALGGFGRARILALAVLGGVIGGLLAREVKLARATQLTTRVALLGSPVVHPWYAGWFLMIEPLKPSAPWLLFTALMVVNYGWLHTPAEGRAFHPSWLQCGIEYGAPALLAGLAWFQRKRMETPDVP